MTLPPLLRQGINKALNGLPIDQLAKASEALSSRYRAELRDGSFHLSNDLKALAYLATRLPATYGAIRDSLDKLLQVYPSLKPKSLLDLGSGPGTVMWAARDTWPDLATVTLVEGSIAIRQQGEKLSSKLDMPKITWLSADLSNNRLYLPEADLVTLAYVLNELEPETQEKLITQVWNLTKQVLLIVEPGSTSGWERLMRLRKLLLNKGANILAPCPHGFDCPLKLPNWCHFNTRIERSSLHRKAKQAELAWEDEKYAYLAFSRTPLTSTHARILASPQARSGLITFKLCTQEGSIAEQTFSKRDGAVFKALRRKNWGDSLS
jgi:ribosomal protein RSM22 (predicted rRNA methylase)